MKTSSTVGRCLFLFLLCCQAYEAMANNKRITLFGRKYADGETAYIDCSVRNTRVNSDYENESTWRPGVRDWSVSSNFSGQPSFNDVVVTFAANREDGFIRAEFYTNEVVTVYITQRSTPSLTITPTLCVPGQSGDFSATLNFYGPSTANVVWETTGGLTVNGGTFYRTTDNTLSRVTVQHNAYGIVSVYGEIPGCDNMRTKTTTYNVGSPATSDLILNSSPAINGSICNEQVYSLQLQNNLPASQYTFSWDKIEGGAYFRHNPDGPFCYIEGRTFESGIFGIIELTITNSACGTSSKVGKGFQIENCNGSYRVAANPTSDNLTVLFNSVDDEKYLPNVLKITHEKKGVVKETAVREQCAKEAAKAGLRIDLDVRELPRDTYYLQADYDNGKTQRVRISLQ